MNLNTLTNVQTWNTRLVRYQVVRSDGRPYGLSVLVPLSKVLDDCRMAVERGIVFTLDYIWNGHEGVFIHQQLPEWY